MDELPGYPMQLLMMDLMWVGCSFVWGLFERLGWPAWVASVPASGRDPQRPFSL